MNEDYCKQNDFFVSESEIDEELKSSFLSYSYSVITNRAIPSALDGLKPIHRRIIYAMYQSSIFPNKPFKKSAKIVGETIAKFHPHGDKSVYDALVRMGQWFRMRYPIIIPQGNFGSIDGDSPAAMRYTETKLSKYAMTLLKDIEFNVVKYHSNYDNSLKEPIILPSKLPNLLLNGSDGIAVGMVTKIPPHNISEIINATIYLAQNPEASVASLFDYVKGPDFPTGGLIIDNDELKKIYLKGNGSVTIKSKWHENKNNQNKREIIITEIPFYIRKNKLIQQIAEVAEKNKIKGIYDVRDETSRNGLRIVIELTDKANITSRVVADLYKFTHMKYYYHCNFLTLDDIGRPRENLNIKQILQVYIKQQCRVIYKKYSYLLGEVIYHINILQALKKTIENIDDVVKIIKNSKNQKEAIKNLQVIYQFSHSQAKEVLNMKLQKLLSLELNNIVNKIRIYMENMAKYNSIIESKSNVKKQFVKELLLISKPFLDERKSTIIFETNDEEVSYIKSEKFVLTLTHSGYVKLIPLNEFKLQNKGGVGNKFVKLTSNDKIKIVLFCDIIDRLLFITNFGRVYSLEAYKIPQEARNINGIYINNLLPNLKPNESIIVAIPCSSKKLDNYLLLLTKNNKIKKIWIHNLAKINISGKKIINSENKNDRILDVVKTTNYHNYIVGTASGKVINSKVGELRNIKSANSTGVRALSLKERPIAITTNNKGSMLLILSKLGYGKLTPLKQFRITKRGGRGVIALKVNAKTGPMHSIMCVKGNETLLINTKKNKNIYINVSKISISSRNASGIRLMKLAANDYVKSATVILENDFLNSGTTKYQICIA